MLKLNLQIFASTYREDEEITTTTSTESTSGGSTSTTKGGSTSTTITNNAAGKVDAQTQKKYDQYKQGYKQSQAVNNAYKYLQDTLAKKPGAFQSDYKNALDSLYDQVTGREKFKYDMNEDVLYQQYKDMYMKSGQKAMQDTLGQGSALTGGYNNTYAQMAAQQAYNDYLGALNDKVPELYQQAYDRYQQEGDDLYEKFSMASDLYGKEYAQHRDNVTDWQTDRDYASGMYQSERDFDYNDFQTMLDFYQNEYWNQRHALSTSETETSNWSTTEENHWGTSTGTTTNKTTNKTTSTSSSGSGGSGSGSSGSGGSSSSGNNGSGVSSVSTYQQATEYLKSIGKDTSNVVTYNEYQVNWNLKNQFGSGPENYINYLNYMCGF